MLIIYTDGASSRKHQNAGWAFVVLQNGIPVIQKSGSVAGMTNNQAELWAVIVALSEIEKHGFGEHNIRVVSDSEYVVKGASLWIHSWKKNNWEKVKNVNLWKLLDEYLSRLQVSFKWVRGHSGNFWNNEVNDLAVKARLKGTYESK